MNKRANRPAMGIATETSSENKARYHQFLRCFDLGEVEKAVADNFHDAA